MIWSLGSNDAANIFGLAVSTRVLKFWTAAITVTSMTACGLPVSTSQAVGGLIIGIGVLEGNVHWATLIKVEAAWVFTPVGGAIFFTCSTSRSAS